MPLSFIESNTMLSVSKPFFAAKTTATNYFALDEPPQTRWTVPGLIKCGSRNTKTHCSWLGKLTSPA